MGAVLLGVSWLAFAALGWVARGLLRDVGAAVDLAEVLEQNARLHREAARLRRREAQTMARLERMADPGMLATILGRCPDTDGQQTVVARGEAATDGR